MSKEEFLRHCKICGVSNFEQPLRVYTNLDCRALCISVMIAKRRF